MSEFGKHVPEGVTGSEYSPEIISNVEQVARKMIASGETDRTIGVGGAMLFVSTDKHHLIGEMLVIVDGKDFYVGIAKTSK